MFKFIKADFTAKTIAQIFLILLLSQLFLAIIYDVERVSFLDAAFVLTKIINEGHPVIMVGRYGAFLTQMWPWLGVKLGLDIDSLILIYSVSFPLLFWMIACILYRVEQYLWVILLGFYMLLFNTESYFWTNNEIHQAIALFCLGMGLFDYYKDSNSRYRLLILIGISLLIGLSVLTHPLMLIVFVYYFIFEFIHHRQKFLTIQYFILYGITFVFGIIKYALSRTNWYDSQKISTVQNLNSDEILNVVKDPEFIKFFSELPLMYPMVLIGISILMKDIIDNRQWSKGVLSLGFLFCHVILVSIVVDIYNRFYVESQYMLISFFIVLPLMKNHDQLRISLKRVLGLYAILSVVWWWVQFGVTVRSYTQRVEWIKTKIDTLQKSNQQKGIITALNDEEIALLKFTWALPSESLIISSVGGEGAFTIIIEENLNSNQLSDVFHDCFEARPISYLNPKYFNIKNDQPYIKLDSLNLNVK